MSTPAARGETTVADAVGRTLAELGVTTVFGVVGSGNFHLVDALRRYGARYVAARHEGGAATMADAFARMTGTVPVVSTHQGCGLTNAVTGIAEAAKSRTPMIVLTADTGTTARLSNFRIDQDGLARSVGAEPARILSAATAVRDTVRAFRTAWQDRRTVVLSVPTDVGAQTVSDSQTEAPEVTPAVPVRPDRRSVVQLSELLRGSRRPVFVAGRGAREAGAEIRALAEHTGALTATSAAAHGLFADDPFSLGISGGFSSDFTAETITSADLIIAFGCALNMWTMRHGSLIGPETRVVQIDVEQQSLGAHRAITLGVRGDAALTAEDVLDELRSTEPVRTGLRDAAMRRQIANSARRSHQDFEDITGGGRMDPRRLTNVLDEAIPAERVVTVDSGNFMGYPAAHLAVPDARGFCMTQAFQSIGLGLYTAIGASMAAPERVTVLGAGDGGFLMSVAELETAVRLRLPLLVIVYDDSAYGAEVHHFDVDEESMSIVTFPETDIASIARGFGAEAMTVRDEGDLARAAERIRAGVAAPLVVDAKIASDGGSWWLSEAFRGH